MHKYTFFASVAFLFLLTIIFSVFAFFVDVEFLWAILPIAFALFFVNTSYG